jgi:hypothetical protein
VATAAELLIPALIGLATGAVATAYKSRKDLEVKYDIKLRQERIEAYKKLWKELERLAYYAPAQQELTHGVARELAGALRAWYFQIGGLLMSEATREAYFDLQRALRSAAVAGAADHELGEPTAVALKQLGSRLRTTTTDDGATRVGPLLTHSLTGWLRRGRLTPRVTVARAWSFEQETAAGWRIRVVNRSRAHVLRVDRVWFAAHEEIDAEPVDLLQKLPITLYPREAWQGFVADRKMMADGVDDLFRSGRACGTRAFGRRWKARSRSEGDAPASPIPRDDKHDQSARSS